jgi:hypothetical protein
MDEVAYHTCHLCVLQLDVQVVLTGVDRHPEKGIRCYQQYLDHLWQVGTYWQTNF